MTDHNHLPPYEVRGDGLLFHLQDEVRCLVRYASATRVEVEMWCREILLPPDTGNINTSTFRKRLVTSGKIGFNHKDGEDVVPNLRRDIDAMAVALRSQPESSEDAGETTLGDILRKLMGPSTMETLIRYATEGAEFFHTVEPEAYATVKTKGHRETYHLRSRAFKLWLRSEYHRREGLRSGGDDGDDGSKRGENRRPHEKPIGKLDSPQGDDGDDGDALHAVLPQNAVSDAINHLEAIALFEGVERRVYVRVAESDGRYYVDLADDLWRVVEIDEDGWRIIGDPGVRFIRPKGMLALPMPVEDGGAERMRDLLNLAGEGGDRNWRLILAWLAQAFKPKGPYPVLVLLGPQGAAKSTAQRLLRMLVDPSQVPLRTVPRDEHNLYIDAVSSWVLAMDNLGGVSTWLSDALCRLATGGGFSTRQLYENREQELFDAMRPIILNGIGDIVTRPDLLDRSILITLPSIPPERRKLEREIFAEFDVEAPRVLGYLFSAIAEGIRLAPSVQLDDPPRMADFATWATATEEALGAEPGEFMDAYLGSQDEATETALESWAAAAAFIKFAREHEGFDDAWVGTATELLEELNDSVTNDTLKRSKDWPKTPARLSESLNRLSPALLDVGVHVDRPTESKRKGRKLRVYYEDPPDRDPDPPIGFPDRDGKASSPSSPSSPEGGKGDTYAESGGDDGSGGGDGVSSPSSPINYAPSSNGADVVNVKGRPREQYVYVGRSKRYGGPHYFANPYKIGEDGDRDEVLESYQEHLVKLLSEPAGLEALAELREQLREGLPLGCHCAGKDGAPEVLTTDDEFIYCHGQIILHAMEIVE